MHHAMPAITLNGMPHCAVEPACCIMLSNVPLLPEHLWNIKIFGHHAFYRAASLVTHPLTDSCFDVGVPPASTIFQNESGIGGFVICWNSVQQSYSRSILASICSSGHNTK
jgi:hypothetical protein